jgi:Heterokaryon incompatibility protein (HET)
MDDVYRKASRVLIYLGEEDATSNIAMDAITRSMSQRVRTSSIEATTKLIENRPWFHRMWVIQEVALADCALVICGSKCVPWACFTSWRARKEYELEGWIDFPPTLTYGPMAVKQMSLLQQLHETRRSRSTDPRDKVFALMGLLAPEERSSVFVDYSISVSELYLDVATVILKLTKSLRILSGVGGGEDGSPMKASWIPDWSIGLQVTSLELSNPFLEPYDAGGQPYCGSEVRQHSTGTPILSCLGITLDLLSICGTKFPEEDSRRSWYQKDVGRILNEWNGLAVDQIQRTGGLRFSRIFRHSPKARLWVGTGNFLDFAAESCMFPTLLAQPSPTLDQPLDGNRGSTSRKDRHVTVEGIKFCFGRRFCITHTGYYCLAPSSARVGDIVTILIGAPVPHVIRRREDGFYTYVGECHVHGVMGGEALAHLTDELRAMGHRSRPFRQSKSSAPLRRFDII